SPLLVSDAKEFSVLSDEESGEVEVPVWLLSLTGDLIHCTPSYAANYVSEHGPDNFGLSGGEIPRSNGLPPDDPIPVHYGENLAGMLGSPVVVADGSVIGLMTEKRQGPLLTQRLPGWLLRDLAQARR